MKKLGLFCIILILIIAFFNITPESMTAQIPSPDIEDKIRNGEIKLTYELFGAIGDGVTNDAEAIRITHEFANGLCRMENLCLTVYGTSGVTYYIGVLSEPISIQTNVNWTDVYFIIDDFVANATGGNAVNVTQHIFTVDSKFNSFRIGAPQLVEGIEPIKVNPDTTNLSNLLDYLNIITPEHLQAGGGVNIGQGTINSNREALLQFSEVLVRVENSYKRQFIRKGSNQNLGSIQQDLLLLSTQTGHILNEVVWDFETITNIVFYPVDETPLVILNGTFITHTENTLNDGYRNRNIMVRRSNVIVDGLVHMLDESVHLANRIEPNPQANLYLGFINTRDIAHFKLQNAKFQPRQAHNQGTYSISINHSVFTTLDNVSYSCPSGDYGLCYQEFIAHGTDRTTLWGIMATNFNKDLVIKNSAFNRIDSHQGVHNLTIKDTTIGAFGITVNGTGTLLIDNVLVDTSRFIVQLRYDYGSSWNGTIIIRNSILNVVDANIPVPGASRIVAIDNVSGCNDISGCGHIAYNDGTWNFGYDTFFPNLIIDGLTINDGRNRPQMALIPIYFIPAIENPPYAYCMSNLIVMRNVILNNPNNVLPRLFWTPETLDQRFFCNDNPTNVFIFDTEIDSDFSLYNTENSQFRVLGDIRPTISFGTNGSSIASNHHQTNIIIESNGLPLNNDSLRYTWSKSNIDEPENFSNRFNLGQSITKQDTEGIWYLWIYAEDILGNNVKYVSNSFLFANEVSEETNPPEPPVITVPPNVPNNNNQDHNNNNRFPSNQPNDNEDSENDYILPDIPVEGEVVEHPNIDTDIPSSEETDNDSLTSIITLILISVILILAGFIFKKINEE